jgi:tetratricopeptide (TPR) repeat protein
MLMRIREQKGWIRGIFVALIVVFAFSFVIGGVGSGSNFSLSDIIGGSSSSSSTTSSSTAALLKQVKLHPKDGAIWAQLAESYSTDGRAADAISAAEKSVKLRPHNIDGLKTLAGLYQAQATSYNTQAQSLYTEAYTVQQQSPDSSPFDAVSATSTSPLGGALQSPFDQQQSQAASAQISTLETQSNALAEKAVALNTKALAQYKTITNLNVGDAQSWLSYATAAEQTGNDPVALVGYKQFLKLVPSDPIAPQVRTKVKALEKSIAAAKKKAAATTSTGTSTTGTSTTSTTG